ncbi:hypothetical protein TCE0_017f03820 [Talaromyces pinophilus]|uniref:Zn-dependent exopeptidase n=1 Tax=Talaromyces pinophilus TaxID=128442 RepID=A0A6V8H2X6_TALPI|nr:hypothetical protein TCE0_017f03820 [Talaromyces pinophilus]
MQGTSENYLTDEEAENFLLSSISTENIRQWSRTYSAGVHLAGDYTHASSIKALWQSYGIPTAISSHQTIIDDPGPETAVRLIDKNDSGKVLFEVSLVEDVLPSDPTSSIGLPAFHGLSCAGRVVAHLVYANFGRPEDFRFLDEHNISVKDCIVLCKYSANLRGLKVRAAQEAGAAGVILYNDPQEDGEYTVANGYLPYPEGPARHPSAIQRGSVSYFSIAAGQFPTDEFTPQIPSVPISYRDAAVLLRALKGDGLDCKNLPSGWQGALPDIEYYTGASSTLVELVNDARRKECKIHNVIGTIEGLSEECVIIGNHHDSWSVGAVDPVSGSAVMNEIARTLGALGQRGWKPRRKIILASWDNEEYGLVGSTTWATLNESYLKENCVAYEATNGGPTLLPVSSPLLTQALFDAAQSVPSPLENSMEVDQDWLFILDGLSDKGHDTVYSDWLQQTELDNPSSSTPRIDTIGTGSDFTIFQHHLGIPSTDVVFSGGKKNAVFQYHSKYDSYLWMEKFGDPGFRKHTAMAQLWGLMTLRIASQATLPFTAGPYAGSLKQGLSNLELLSDINRRELNQVIDRFSEEAARLDQEAEDSRRHPNVFDQNRYLMIDGINKRYMSIEKSFLNEEGLPQRRWYKHMAFGPGLWEGYGGVVFPAIADALLLHDDALIQEAVDATTKVIIKVAKLMGTKI